MEIENKLIEAELSAVQKHQQRIDATLGDLRDRDRQHVKRILDLENECAAMDSLIRDLGRCYDALKERQDEVKSSQFDIEQKNQEFEDLISDLQER